MDSNYVAAAQRLFTRLSAGDIEGYGGAEFMAEAIRTNLRKAGADAAALDPSGEKSADEMVKALKQATAKVQVAKAQQLFTRLSAGDIGDYGAAEFMADAIRTILQKAGTDAAALDPSGEKSADEMAKALKQATAIGQIAKAQQLFTSLSAGDIGIYGAAEFMADAIRTNLQEAGADAAALDPSGEKSADEMAKALKQATAKVQIAKAQRLFTQISAGDIEGYGGAEFMADAIRTILQKAGTDAAALDPSGEKSADEMAKALKQATAKGQIAKAQRLFTRISAGDIEGYNGAESMAEDIRTNLQEAGADAAALDPSGKKSADEMAKVLNESALRQKFAIGSKPGRNVAGG